MVVYNVEQNLINYRPKHNNNKLAEIHHYTQNFLHYKVQRFYTLKAFTVIHYAY